MAQSHYKTLLGKVLLGFITEKDRKMGVMSSLVFGIVGFNNTIEMQNIFFIDKTEKLVGTIDQNLSVYIDTIFSVADKLFSGEIVQEPYLIKPIPIKRF